MRKLTTLATGLALTGAVASFSTPANAVDVKLYGQVNKALVGYDDGQHTDYVITDNDLSSTRFGFKGEQKLDNGLTASVLYEVEMQSNPSNLFVQDTTAGNSSVPQNGGNGGAGSNVSLDERHASVGLGGDFGAFVLGQTAMATDAALTQDLAGATDVMNADFRKLGGGLNFRTTAGAMSGVTINSMTFDGGVYRTDAVRYDSPKLAGFQAKASVAQGGDMDGSVFYDNKLGDFKIQGALGVEFNNDTTSAATNAVETRTIASVSARHSSGLGATLSYETDGLKNETAGASDPEQWYAKVGYAWDAYEIAADYGNADHYGAPALGKNELTAYGLGAQYNMGNGVSVGGVYRTFSADRTGVSLQDIDLFAANMRVKF